MGDLPTADDVTADSDAETVGRAAYYEACISDPTYHGTDFNRATNVCSNWARDQPDPALAFAMAYDRFVEMKNEMKA